MFLSINFRFVVILQFLLIIGGDNFWKKEFDGITPFSIAPFTLLKPHTKYQNNNINILYGKTVNILHTQIR